MGGWLLPSGMIGAGIALAGTAGWLGRKKFLEAKRSDPVRRPPYEPTSTRTHAA